MFHVSIPMTVLGGLQPLTVLVGIFAVCRFNTDDGIRRATTRFHNSQPLLCMRSFNTDDGIRRATTMRKNTHKRTAVAFQYR